jgi:putative GTP pyrophosphokinase
MILERKMQITIPDLKQQFGEFKNNFTIDDSGNPRSSLLKFAGLIQLYNGAMKEINTKLEVLDDEFHIHHSHNPIHHLECRIKGIKSIVDKMQRYGVPFTLDSVRERVQDIAGIRVICNFLDDIYLMEKLLLQQADITLIKRKDYIEQPKKNGYRSLHIVVKVPVFLSDKTENVPVEIQMRTIAMDYWASLEHALRYKNDKDDMVKYSALLLDCANTLADTEKIMQQIRNSIEK